MPKQYDANNWYWYVNRDTSKVYSSAFGNYVQPNDSTFVAWTSDGTTPTNIDTETNLGGVLADYYPTVTRPIPSGILDGYQQTQADAIFQHKLIKFLFVLNNRVRVLEGNTAFTVAQARAYFKGLM